MKIGDRILVTADNGERKGPPQPGTVVYINREHRYYTVLLDAGYRQSFKEGTTE